MKEADIIGYYLLHFHSNFILICMIYYFSFIIPHGLPISQILTLKVNLYQIIKG